jgi:hypothetical protein
MTDALLIAETGVTATPKGRLAPSHIMQIGMGFWP